jgi:ADP-ribose pyrophosphatase YjhB (NUDIX family)
VPQLKSDVVEVFVVRWQNGRIETLLGKRKSTQPFGSIWQPMTARIELNEPTIEAAKRAVFRGTGLQISDLFAADRTHQFFDHQRDMIVIAPVLAAMVHATQHRPGQDFEEMAWFDTPTAIANLFIAGHRDGLRRIVELLGPGGTEIELYRLV